MTTGTFGASIALMQRTQTKAMRTDIIRTCLGHKKPHAAPELITMLLLEFMRRDPAIAADCGAVAAMKRLLTRNQEVVHAVNRLFVVSEEKPELILKLDGVVGRVMQISLSCKLRLAHGMRVHKGEEGRETIDLARRNWGAVRTFMIEIFRARELTILSKRCAIQMGGYVSMEKGQHGSKRSTGKKKRPHSKSSRCRGRSWNLSKKRHQRRQAARLGVSCGWRRKGRGK